MNLLKYLYYACGATSYPQTIGDWKEESADICEDGDWDCFSLITPVCYFLILLNLDKGLG